MTISMSEKHQVTIPARIAKALDLKRGSLFDVGLNGRRIELIPLEVKEKKLTRAEYRKLDKLLAQSKRAREEVTGSFIDKVRAGKIRPGAKESFSPVEEALIKRGRREFREGRGTDWRKVPTSP